MNAVIIFAVAIGVMLSAIMWNALGAWSRLYKTLDISPKVPAPDYWTRDSANKDPS